MLRVEEFEHNGQVCYQMGKDVKLNFDDVLKDPATYAFRQELRVVESDELILLRQLLDRGMMIDSKVIYAAGTDVGIRRKQLNIARAGYASAHEYTRGTFRGIFWRKDD
jgi:hypothetical protein